MVPWQRLLWLLARYWSTLMCFRADPVVERIEVFKGLLR
jgi:hypothetical protein